MRRRTWHRRDPSDVDLGTILDYAERARQGDEDARQVLHDALLTRHPRIYSRLIRLAESRTGSARIVGPRADTVIGCAYSGARAILLDTTKLAYAESRARQPRVREPQMSRMWTKSREYEHAVAESFYVVNTAIIRAGGSEVITYISRNDKACAPLGPRPFLRDVSPTYEIHRYDRGRWLVTHETRDLAQANRHRAALRARGYQARVREKGTGTPRDPDQQRASLRSRASPARSAGRERGVSLGHGRDPPENRKRPHQRHEHRVMDKRTLRRMALQAIGRPDIAQGPLHDALLEMFPQVYKAFIQSADGEAARMGHQVEVVLRVNQLSKTAQNRAYSRIDASPFYTRYHESGFPREAREAVERRLHMPRVVTYVTPFGLKMSDLT